MSVLSWSSGWKMIRKLAAILHIIIHKNEADYLLSRSVAGHSKACGKGKGRINQGARIRKVFLVGSSRPVFSSAFIWDLKKSSIRSFWLPNFLGCFFRFSKISECCTSFKAEIQLNLAIFIWNIFSGTSINTTIFLACRTIQCELYHVRIRFFCCRWSCYRLQVHSTPGK